MLVKRLSSSVRYIAEPRYIEAQAHQAKLNDPINPSIYFYLSPRMMLSMMLTERKCHHSSLSTFIAI